MAATIDRPSTLATLLVGILATACTVTSDPAARPSHPAARSSHPASGAQEGTMADLQQAIARWHQVSTVVVYRTERQQPGLPSSAHQCLRRFVDDRADIPIGLAKCDPAGVARLAWYPPARWRLEIAEANREVSATVVGHRSVVCTRVSEKHERCRRRSNQWLVRSFPFHELVTGARSVLHELGIEASGPVTVTHRRVGSVSADCYERASGESSAEWCFGNDGTLLALELRTPDRAPTSVEVKGL